MHCNNAVTKTQSSIIKAATFGKRDRDIEAPIKINRVVIYLYVFEEYFPMLVLLTDARVWTGGWQRG